MAIKTLEERKKQQKLMIIGGLLVLATLIILYFGFLKNDVGNSITVSPQPGVEENQSGAVQPGSTAAAKKQPSGIVLEEKLKKIDLNTDFFVKTILSTLKVYGAIPVEKGATGRSNPFTAQ